MADLEISAGGREAIAGLGEIDGAVSRAGQAEILLHHVGQAEIEIIQARLRLHIFAEPAGKIDIALIHYHLDRLQYPVGAVLVDDGRMVEFESNIIGRALRREGVGIGCDGAIDGQIEWYVLLAGSDGLDGAMFARHQDFGAAGGQYEILIAHISHLDVGSELHLVMQHDIGGQDGATDIDFHVTGDIDGVAGGVDCHGLIAILAGEGGSAFQAGTADRQTATERPGGILRQQAGGIYTRESRLVDIDTQGLALRHHQRIGGERAVGAAAIGQQGEPLRRAGELGGNIDHLDAEIGIGGVDHGIGMIERAGSDGIERAILKRIGLGVQRNRAVRRQRPAGADQGEVRRLAAEIA